MDCQPVDKKYDNDNDNDNNINDKPAIRCIQMSNDDVMTKRKWLSKWKDDNVNDIEIMTKMTMTVTIVTLY